MQRRHFTLIELLVVVAIIGILASLLLPALRQAQDKANAVACLSNLRQVSQAVSIYATDNQDRMPPWRVLPASGVESSRWWNYLASTEGDSTITPASTSYAWGYLRIYVYDFNNGKAGRYPSTWRCPKISASSPGTAWCSYGANVSFGQIVLDGGGGEVWNDAKHKLSAIREPAHKFLVADSLMSDPDKVINWQSYPTYNNLAYPGPGAYGPVHSEGSNQAWADGHASWLGGVEFVAGSPGVSVRYYMDFDRN